MKHLSVFILLLLSQVTFANAMTIDADRFELVHSKQQADFFGNVVIQRGNMTIKAEKVRVWYQEDKKTGKKVLKKTEATGNVDIVTNDSKGKSDYALFTTASSILVMKGNAHMTSQQGTAEGEHITYNTKTKDTKVVGGDSGKQVRFTFDEDAQ